MTASVVYAQTNTFPTTGSAGIGTSNPTAKLEVVKPGGDAFMVRYASGYPPLGISVGGSSGVPGIFGNLVHAGSGNFWNYAFGTARLGWALGDPYYTDRFNIYVGKGDAGGLFNGVTAFSIQPTGNVGIGVINPVTKLDVSGDLRLVSPVDGQAVKILARSDDFAQIAFYTNSGSRINSLIQTHSDGAISFVNSQPLSERLRISGDGRVGIGTSTPTHKLTVNGSVRAKEVIVEAAGWPDYVFEEGYQRLSLSEIEKHLAEFRHLPGIPSSAEVAKKGVSIGEMQVKLLQKLEEMTLHMIDLQKQNDELRCEIEELKRTDR
ncbi:MAG: hypothetical protein SFV32_13900 [Opitutaceae bacterium]|nr:hypothetical protein [Opitutaceae bacterium]